MLAGATTVVMLVGPGIIGYIPVCVVGALIYLLGYELLKEALFDTVGKLRKFEYATIVIIVITMGAWDFVYGILVGILLACVSFVVEASGKPIVSGIYTGEYARSIVIRHPKQHEFLENVGKQTYIMKLHGSLFFGSIGGLEEQVRSRFDHSRFDVEPIKYLILDMNNVLGIDFSAAEGFRRIRNLLMEKNCYLIISSISENSSITQSLKDCGLWETEEHNEKIQLFNNLNSALEWCENLFLEKYKELIRARHSSAVAISVSNSQKRKLPISMFNDGSSQSKSPFNDPASPVVGSPRNTQIWNAAKKTVRSQKGTGNYDVLLNRAKGLPSNSAINQPLSLVLTVMQGLSEKTDESFWSKLTPYLSKMTVKPSELIYDKHIDQPSVFFVENGLINYEIGFKNLHFYIKSSVLPLTIFGDVTVSNSERSIKYYGNANSDSVVWKLDGAALGKLQAENEELYEELLLVSLRLTTGRHDVISSNLLISA
ncbi:unnamed protein product [Ambrosiozyma monospora]|uniref:Unnamed protein product n=1 Tax=Ambrosiozyma monospora TaxID=43982 RepID=A0ACB5T3F7_AMBMO|nr:unnamed protein product [Ambrosiozyma monospora]